MIKIHDKTRTLKRRQLVSEKIRSSRKKTVISEEISDFNYKNNDEHVNSTERCDSPLLPCNQDEYLIDSGNTSTCSDVPRSTDNLHTSVADTLETTVLSTDFKAHCTQNNVINKEIEDLSEEMFFSKLNQSIPNHVTSFDSTKKYSCDQENQCYQLNIDNFKTKIENVVQNNDSLEKFAIPENDLIEDPPKSIKSGNLVTRNMYSNRNQVIEQHNAVNKSIKTYEDIVEDSFDFINQTISKFNPNKCDIKTHHESTNSAPNVNQVDNIFEDDIDEELLKERSTNQSANYHKTWDLVQVIAKSNNEIVNFKSVKQLKHNTFYGLPLTAKDLFKAYRKIEKFYGNYQ